MTTRGVGRAAGGAGLIPPFLLDLFGGESTQAMTEAMTEAATTISVAIMRASADVLEATATAVDRAADRIESDDTDVDAAGAAQRYVVRGSSPASGTSPAPPAPSAP